MAVSPEYRDFIEELFLAFGPVKIRAMFGGAGVYFEGVMFALIADETLYLKVDQSNQHLFEEEGSEPFTYDGKGKPITMSYWTLPERLYEESDEIAAWARASYAVALKAKNSSLDRKRRRKTK